METVKRQAKWFDKLTIPSKVEGKSFFILSLRGEVK
jgi:hypothetical protein